MGSWFEFPYASAIEAEQSFLDLLPGMRRFPLAQAATILIVADTVIVVVARRRDHSARPNSITLSIGTVLTINVPPTGGW